MLIWRPGSVVGIVRAQHQDLGGWLCGSCLGDLRQGHFLYSEHVPKPWNNGIILTMHIYGNKIMYVNTPLILPDKGQAVIGLESEMYRRILEEQLKQDTPPPPISRQCREINEFRPCQGNLVESCLKTGRGLGIQSSGRVLAWLVWGPG